MNFQIQFLLVPLWWKYLHRSLFTADFILLNNIEHTLSIVFANSSNEAINGGQVQLPKLRINGAAAGIIFFKFNFSPVVKSNSSKSDGISSPTLKWNRWAYIMSKAPLNIFHPTVQGGPVSFQSSLLNFLLVRWKNKQYTNWLFRLYD